jgi:hypothetical protein
MSRLETLDIPFTKGLNEAIGDQVLAAGGLVRAENCRINRLGEIELRPGWRAISTDRDSSQIRIEDLFVHQDALYGTATTLGDTPSFVSLTDPSSADSGWNTRDGDLLDNLVDFVGFDIPGIYPSGDQPVFSAINGENIAIVVRSAMSLNLGRALIFKRTSLGQVIFVRGFSFSAVAVVPRSAADGGFSFIQDNGGGSVTLHKWSPGDTSISSVATLSGFTSIQEGHVASDPQDTTGQIHLVEITSGATNYRAFAQDGTAGSIKAVSAGTDISAVLSVEGSTVAVLVQRAADHLINSFNKSTLSDIQALTSCGSSTAGTTGKMAVEPSFPLGAVEISGGGIMNVGASFALETPGSSELVCCQVPETNLFGVSHDNNLFWGNFNFFLSRLRQNVGTSQLDTATDFRPYTATTNNEYVLLVDRAPSPRAYLCRRNRYDKTSFASISGRMYVALGDLWSFSATSDAELVGRTQPDISATPNTGGGGAMALGTYLYTAALEQEEGEFITRGIFSDPVEVTLTGSEVRVSFTATAQEEGTMKLFRTEQGPGELFYLVSERGVTAGSVETFDDLLNDANIIEGERPYTEGEFGVVSGALDLCPPGFIRYVTALRDRLVVAQGSNFFISQVLLPGEIAGFAQPGISGPIAFAYQNQVKDQISGVWGLDDQLLIGTRSAWYFVSGEGPNQAGQGGEFSSPARLPSDVGLFNHRSLVEDSAGVWFEADPGKLYLIARGGSSPSFEGKAVQTSLEGLAIAGADRNSSDHTTLWALESGSTTGGRILVRDQFAGNWFIDTCPVDPSCIQVADGVAYVASGRAHSTYGQVYSMTADVFGDGVGGADPVTLVFETPDSDRFGLDGWGRLHSLSAVGKLIDGGGDLEAFISYDAGQTWTSLGTHTIEGSAGDPFQVQWGLRRARGSRFRFRGTMTPASPTTQGLKLSGLSVHYKPKKGPSRKPARFRK